ncbi:MAG TPA: AP2/ERF family transcription factor [Chitinivibrionales bacterium]|nr:AP2/ERF family transcription factor [Chitinivibrionales bacterium]
MPENFTKPFELRNISRIDRKLVGRSKADHAWQVRFKRKNKPMSNWFEDRKYGDKEKALEAAKIYRDAMEIQFGGFFEGGHTTELNVNKNNLVGVWRRVRMVNYKSGPKEFPVWVATWSVGHGKHKVKAFSVSKYGEDEAQRLAIEARNNRTKSYSEKVNLIGNHIAYHPPKNGQVKIWRYMDFTKFVSILQHKGLFFSRIDKLGDSFEGSFSKVNKLLRPLLNKHRSLNSSKCGEIVKELRKWIMASCWHINDQESAAMWNLYAKTNEAICIQSTYEKLKKLCPSPVKIGIIQYVDYEKDWIIENDPILPFLHKRKSFEHEQEVRAIYNLSGLNSFSDPLPTDTPMESGVWFKIDLKELIDRVYIAPQASDWFYRLVLEESKIHGYSFPVKKSSLEEEPFF